MPAICGSIATLAVATVFYMWRAHVEGQLNRDRRLRERVAYMLWTMACRLQDSSPEFELAVDGPNAGRWSIADFATQG